MTNKELIDAINEFNGTEKRVIAKNIDLLFGTYYKSKRQKNSIRSQILAGITGVSIDAAKTWTSLKRDTGIPLMKLLLIAEAFGVHYKCFLDAEDDWLNEKTESKLRNRIEELEGVYRID